MNWADEVNGADDAQLVRVVRGMNAVDRAVRRFRDRTMTEWKIPTAVAIKIGWPLCGRCGRPIVPWQVVRWRFGDWHPTCITAHLSEHGAAASASSSGPVLAREAW